jgi:hypothetical protein
LKGFNGVIRLIKSAQWEIFFSFLVPSRNIKNKINNDKRRRLINSSIFHSLKANNYRF